MAEVLTFLEHQSIPIRPARQPGELAITSLQACQLNKMKGIPANAFRWGHQSLQWRQFCGVVQLQGLTLEILPKIYGKEATPGSCRTTLIKMLRKAGLMKVHRGAGASIHAQHHTLLDIFIQEFCLQVQEQNLIGKPRDYQQLEGNLGVVKGKLFINKQLRANPGHRERLYCQYDELTEDMPLNQIIKFTLRVLLPQCKSNRSQKAVIKLLMQYHNLTDCRFNTTDIDRIHLNRINERYRAILSWCRLFLGNQNPDITAGQHSLPSILFDMNILFERWLASELRPIAHDAGVSVKEQSPRKYLAYRPDIEKNVFQTKPDLSLIDQKANVVMILDAKWKLLKPEEAKLGISQGDLYQLVAYGNRYGVRQLVLVYPAQATLAKRYSLNLLGGQCFDVSVWCVDVSQPIGEVLNNLGNTPKNNLQPK